MRCKRNLEKRRFFVIFQTNVHSSVDTVPRKRNRPNRNCVISRFFVIFFYMNEFERNKRERTTYE